MPNNKRSHITSDEYRGLEALHDYLVSQRRQVQNLLRSLDPEVSILKGQRSRLRDLISHLNYAIEELYRLEIDR